MEFIDHLDFVDLRHCSQAQMQDVAPEYCHEIIIIFPEFDGECVFWRHSFLRKSPSQTLDLGFCRKVDLKRLLRGLLYLLMDFRFAYYCYKLKQFHVFVNEN